MLWAKIGVIAGAALIATTLSIYKTGKMAVLAEENGIQAQALVQKEHAIAQERVLREQEEAERLKAEEEYQKAMNALSDRERAARESQERANGLLAQIRRLESENLELQAWARREHPSAIIGVYQSATGDDPAGAGDNHEDGDQESPAESY